MKAVKDITITEVFEFEHFEVFRHKDKIEEFKTAVVKLNRCALWFTDYQMRCMPIGDELVVIFKITGPHKPHLKTALKYVSEEFYNLKVAIRFADMELEAV